ncbi:carbon-monoxide dehydrogenase small subunit [Ensifer adhaerens]|nr:carbon-monoxide dehydrogenase small subunit [Ensifer adhaerens]
MTIDFRLNGTARSISCAADKPLIGILRDDLCLTSTKEACSIGRCGACLVLIDGKAANACLTMAFQISGTEIMTTEGLGDDPMARLVRKALIEENAFQCGYCAPGFVVALLALFKENPAPGEDDIRKGLEGNICRCTGYHSIIRGALAAALLVQETSK